MSDYTWQDVMFEVLGKDWAKAEYTCYEVGNFANKIIHQKHKIDKLKMELKMVEKTLFIDGNTKVGEAKPMTEIDLLIKENKELKEQIKRMSSYICDRCIGDDTGDDCNNCEFST